MTDKRTATPLQPGTPAGWYLDPEMANSQRYWDGNAWTKHVAPAAAPAQPRRITDGYSTTSLVLAIIGAVLTTIPIVGWLVGGTLDGLAVILGIIGFNVNRHRGGTSAIASAGTTIGLLAIVAIFVTGAGTIW